MERVIYERGVCGEGSIRVGCSDAILGIPCSFLCNVDFWNHVTILHIKI